MVSDMAQNEPFLPPRPVIRAAWRAHRALYRVSKGRLGLRDYQDGTEGLAQLTTTGRRSGEPRNVMIAYFDDGDDFVTMAMNRWDVADPAWWLNLQANPNAMLTTTAGDVPVTGRAAVGDESTRLWDRWRELDHNIDKYSGLRTEGTPVVILSPQARPEVAHREG